MTKNKPLYQDKELKIDYLPTSNLDHAIWIKEPPTDDESEYILPRGGLKELAQTPRGGIEKVIENFNSSIIDAVYDKEIGIDGLHVALCQAYAEQERQQHKNNVKYLLKQIKQNFYNSRKIIR